MNMEELEVKQLAAKLDDLQEQLKKALYEAEKGKAYMEINNLMGRYAFNNGAGNFGGVLEQFADKVPDVSGEIAWFGLAVGMKKIKEMWFNFQTFDMQDRTGFLCNNYMCTPVVEIAEDLQTAQGVWFSPGFETIMEDGEGVAYWCYGKYACDFIKQDGEWRIWHLHMYPIFRIPQNESWAREFPSIEEYLADTYDGWEGLPTFEPTTFMDEYSINRIPKYWPQPPKPYKTFSETHTMVGAPGEDVIIDPDTLNEKWLTAHGYEFKISPNKGAIGAGSQKALLEKTKNK